MQQLSNRNQALLAVLLVLSILAGTIFVLALPGNNRIVNDIDDTVSSLTKHSLEKKH